MSADDTHGQQHAQQLTLGSDAMPSKQERQPAPIQRYNAQMSVQIQGGKNSKTHRLPGPSSIADRAPLTPGTPRRNKRTNQELVCATLLPLTTRPTSPQGLFATGPPAPHRPHHVTTTGESQGAGNVLPTITNTSMPLRLSRSARS